MERASPRQGGLWGKKAHVQQEGHVRLGGGGWGVLFWNFFWNKGEKGEIKSRVLISLLDRLGLVRACSPSLDPSGPRRRQPAVYQRAPRRRARMMCSVMALFLTSSRPW